MSAPAEMLYARDRVIAGVEKLRFFPLAVESGEGCWLVEAGGRRLLDLSATWTAAGLGHGHPAVVETIRKAAERPPGAGGLSAVHPDSVGLAEDLLRLTPGGPDRRVYLGHAGTDANDVALRCARYATGRHRVLAFEHSYHGGMGVAMGASGVHVDAGSVATDPGITFIPYPNPYRANDPDEAVAASLRSVEQECRSGDVACVIVEPILSDGGLVVPPDGFLRKLTELCTKLGVLTICDEIKVGLGRPGTVHAFQRDEATPDLITFGKVLGAGLPISAAVGPAAVLDQPVASALLTTAGNPVCTAVARTVLRVLVRDGLAARAKHAGDRLRRKLREATATMDCVGDIRGAGLVIGVELVHDRQSKEPAPQMAAQVVYRLWQLGAVCYYVGRNVLEVTPPLVISDEEVDHAVDLIATAIDDAKAGRVDEKAVSEFSGW